MILGDAFEVLADLDEKSVQACVTDPPYGLSSMGLSWDVFAPEETAKRVHRLTAPDAEMRPNLKGRARSPLASPASVEYDYSVGGLRAYQAWCARWGREVFRVLTPGAYLLCHGAPRAFHRAAAGLEDAGFEIRDTAVWLFGKGMPKSLNLPGGRGTGLKPGWEPIIIARRPPEGTTTKTVETYGTGAYNIQACRTDEGRWPSNVLLDGYVAEQIGEKAQFFYVSKASRAERDLGLDDLPVVTGGAITGRAEGSAGLANPRAGAGRTGGLRNIHSTVKPLALMRWLVRLVTPPEGLVLDPFMGSGTTGMAAVLEGRTFLGVEKHPPYYEIAVRRIAWAAERALQ